MTVAERIYMIRLLEEMEKSEKTEKKEDGTLVYDNGMLVGKMIRKEES